MRIVFFVNGGALALEPLRAVASRHEVALVIRPRPRRPWWRQWARRAAQALGRRPVDDLGDWLRPSGLPVLLVRSGRDPAIAVALRRITPDLACIATFPWLLDASLLDQPRLGILNLHPSLLPRHRGPAPYFWTYYHNDRDTGATVHRAVPQADAGPILGREAFSLHRGRPLDLLHEEIARRGAGLMLRAVESLEAGTAVETPQEERLASPAPRVRPGVAMVDYGEWDVERVWHFLAGLCPHYREPLAHRGRPAGYRRVLGFERGEPMESPGTLTAEGKSWRLHCQGGFVRLLSC
ncbi:MAG: methionyl-tRNA formyltransferase [Gemmatimonadales bacterium]